MADPFNMLRRSAAASLYAPTVNITHARARTHARPGTHTRTHAHARTHARPGTHAHAHTHRARTHAHTHTHARTHTRTARYARTRTYTPGPHTRARTHYPTDPIRKISNLFLGCFSPILKILLIRSDFFFLRNSHLVNSIHITIKNIDQIIWKIFFGLSPLCLSIRNNVNFKIMKNFNVSGLGYAYKMGDVLFYFRFGESSNAKIAPKGAKIWQLYSFSKRQYEYIQSEPMPNPFGLFEDGRDAAVCFDCPFSKTNGYAAGKCYTHKLDQARGFRGSLKAIHRRLGGWNNIPDLPEFPPSEFLEMLDGRYFRFGTYGEPSILPVQWVKLITMAAAIHTGYTHQWRRAPEYAPFFMASAHSPEQAAEAAESGQWRSFTAVNGDNPAGMVSCPTQYNDTVTCAKCGLCSGNTGKGKKSVSIQYH